MNPRLQQMKAAGERVTAYSVLNVKSVEDQADYYVVKGIASTPRVDRVGDIVSPTGAKYAKPIDIPFLLGHKSMEPIGRVKQASSNKDGISFESRIPKVKEAGVIKDRIDAAVQSIKYNLMGAVSIGFNPVWDKIEELPNGGLHFKEWDWLELSLVTIPANPDAVITGLKSLDTEIRAALGAKDRGSSQPPGAAGQARGKAMKTLKELQERRGTVAARMKEIDEGCAGDRAQLSAEESEEFDGLKKELRTLDAQIDDRQAMEQAISGATVVRGSDPEEGARSRAPRIDVKAGPTLKDGLAFAQYTKIKLAAESHRISPYALAQTWQKRMPGYIDPRVVAMTKGDIEGATVGGTTTAGNWGMELIGTEVGPVADFLEYLRPMTILGKFGTNGIPALRRVPFRAPLVGMTSGGTGYWVGEGKAKPVTKFEFSRTHLDPLKVAVISVASKEWLADSSPSGDVILRDALVSALRAEMDTAFIDPANNGSAGVKPAAITYNITAPNASGTDADAVRGDLKSLITVFTAANNPLSSAVFIMPTSVALTLSMMMNGLGQPEFPDMTMTGGRLVGFPVIVSDYVPVVTAGAMIVLVNAQDVYYADDGGFTVDTSEHASIEMADNPGGDIITPTAQTGKVVSMYQENAVAYRAERRVDWMLRRTEGVAVIDTVNYV